jgi:hypothetical protein
MLIPIAKQSSNRPYQTPYGSPNPANDNQIEPTNE